MGWGAFSAAALALAPSVVSMFGQNSALHLFLYIFFALRKDSLPLQYQTII